MKTTITNKFSGRKKSLAADFDLRPAAMHNKGDGNEYRAVYAGL